MKKSGWPGGNEGTGLAITTDFMLKQQPLITNQISIHK